jgi:uncharacterized protein (TIGR03085 family)
VISLARAERAELADLFAEVGPEAPTLCGTWRTRELAAHLIVRERRVLASSGIWLKPLNRVTEHAMADVAQEPWQVIVDKVRAGPPRWWPVSFEPIDRLTNGLEYFVHHEDVRRTGHGWRPRELPDEHEDFIWSVMRSRAGVFLRSAPVGVVLRTRTGAEKVAKDDDPRVVVTGKPSEIALFLYGRQRVADVELTGDPDAVEQLRTASLGA